MKTTPIASPLVAAIESAWAAIQAEYSDLPDVVVTIGSGDLGRGMKLGHFAPNSWTQGEESVHELFIGAEGLARGAEAVMATLLHEAAHAWAAATGTKDTSRNGRYHNEKFKMIGERFGLKLDRDPTIGWSITTITESAVLAYVDAILDLDLAITAHRRSPRYDMTAGAGAGAGAPVPLPTATKKKTSNGVVAACDCGRKIRITQSVLDAAPIICGECQQEFTAQ